MTSLISSLQQWLPRRKIDIFGKNSLMKSSIPYYIISVITASGLFNNKASPFFFISLIYSVFPILDQIFSLDNRNPSPEERKKLEQSDPYFRAALYTAMILSWGVNIKMMYNMSTAQIDLGNLIKIIAIIFITSNLFSAQFAIAHEIMHKPHKFYRYLGTFHMINLYYPHFTYHHLYKHHYQVATPLDPSTSKKGENVYQFIIRCIKGSWVGVYRDQQKIGKKWYTNYAVLSLLSSLTFGIIVFLVFGLQAAIIHSLMAFGAIFYLQAINYIEHYGLSRKQLPNGQYEKVTILHSWNAPHRFTNYLLFKLQRHSDHHQNSSKPYQTLVSMDQSPFLPHGYTLMILMSFFPKIWFRIMDPLVDAYSKLDVNKREKIDPAIMEISLTQTRKFLIEIALSSALLLILSMLKVI